MKFETRNEAKRYAKSENRITGKKHRVVKDKYLSLKTFEFIDCYCVVLDIVRGRA